MPDIIHIDISSPYFVILLVFGAAWLIQLVFYGLVFSRLGMYKKKRINTKSPPVSVVISAKNEYTNLKKFLEKILTQNYREFEVVVVNHNSDDDTEYLLNKLSSDYTNLSVVNLRDDINFFKGKKFPLSVGIKSAKHDLLLFTDADCYPSSKYWIRDMVDEYEDDGNNIVLGYGAYEARAGILNKLIRYDTLHSAMQYLGLALAGIPYMGVGRNVMYHRGLFYSAGGFTKHYKLSGGDDDLFINTVARKKNTSVSVSADAITVSIPKASFREWKIQKKRHLSTASSYRLIHKIILGLYWLSHMAFYFCLIALLIVGFAYPYVLTAFVLRFIIQLLVVKKSMKQLGEKNLLLFSPLIDVMYLFLNPYMYLSLRISGDEKWK